MATPDNIFPISCQPGVQRDGTEFDSPNYLAARWCRFYRGRPQKMGGYRKMIGWPKHVTQSNIPRGVFVVPNSPLFNIYIGDFNSLQYFPADSATGVAVGPLQPITPPSLTPSPYNQWIFDVMFSTLDDSTILIAMANRNLFSIDQNVRSPIFYGDINSNAPLQETGFYTAGGFVVLHPYLFIFDNNGHVKWSKASNPTTPNENDPNTYLGEARVTGTKIVAGFPTRGGNLSPAGLLWSLDSVIRVTQVGSERDGTEFSFDTITSESSILSSNGIIEYDGIFYWAGVDRFLCYNGVVQELPNSMSLQYFFDTLNYAQRQKVWATKYSKYGEIWWHFPSGTSVECDKAVIYNVREKCWYDVDISRSCGHYEQTFSKPVWASNSLLDGTTPNQYVIWQQEVGVDKVEGNNIEAINSGFEMSFMSWVADGPGGQNAATDKTINAYRFEPDFVQKGDLTLIVNGRQYANSPNESSQGYTFNPTPEDADPVVRETKYQNSLRIYLREQRRLMTLEFNSAVIGGYYQMGKCLLIPRMGDTRP